MTETEAVRAVQAGDADGLTFLVTAYELKAMRVAFAITGDRLQAEDVVADAFLEVVEIDGGRLAIAVQLRRFAAGTPVEVASTVADHIEPLFAVLQDRL